MNYIISFLLLSTIKLSDCKNYDEISEINYKVWSKNHLTWSFVNYPKNLIVEHKNSIYYEFSGAFRAWELISDFKFEFLMNTTDADIVITFTSPKHELFPGDYDFADGSLAHAYFPENGDIHMNDNVNWSLSFYYQPNTINMFYVIAHEIGHSLSLNHITDLNSIMFPAYLNRNYDAFNFTFKSVDEELIRHMYSNHFVSPTTTTTVLPTTVKTEKTTVFTETTKTTTVPTSTFTSTTQTSPKSEDFYPDFSLCKMKDEIDWCNDNLIFNIIYDIEGYLFLYKNIDFWMFTENDGIKSRKFNHYDYWSNIEYPGLVTIIKIKKDIVLFYETYAKVLNCQKGENNLNYSSVNITNRINGVYYNYSKDILYLFSKETPRTYFKVYHSGKSYFKNFIKPISLFELEIYNYDVVFQRKNNVYFVRNNIIDYYDFDLGIIVKEIEFRDLFLRNQCDLSPLLNFRNYSTKNFDSRFV